MPSRVQFRNPYPVPDVSSEGFWIPPGPILGDKVTINDSRWSTKLDIHERLFAHHTLNSIRKNQRFVRTKAPNDALDLALTSAYVHNEDTLVPKMYVSMQPESLGRKTWRVLRNELMTSSPQFGITSGSDQNEESRRRIEDRASEQDHEHDTPKMASEIKMAVGSDTAMGIKMASGSNTASGIKIALGTNVPAEIKTASGSNKASGIKIASGKNVPAGIKMSAGNKIPMRPKMAARAISAPARASHKAQGGQLHKYADRTRHDGIPDRIERIHPSSLKLAIAGPHMDQTNAGYSRKEDGTYYAV